MHHLPKLLGRMHSRELLQLPSCLALILGLWGEGRGSWHQAGVRHGRGPLQWVGGDLSLEVSEQTATTPHSQEAHCEAALLAMGSEGAREQGYTLLRPRAPPPAFP